MPDALPGLSFLGHSTVRHELGGRVVLTDPVLTRRVGGLTRVVDLPDPADHADVDLVLLSHLHGDHLHGPSLRLLTNRPRVVVPRGAGEWLRRKGIDNVVELGIGEELRGVYGAFTSRRRILPVGPFGSSSTSHTCRGYL